MDPTAKPCSICRGQVAPTTIPQMSGEDAGVKMSIDGMPAVACAEGHRRFLAPDFAIRMMETLLGAGPLVDLPPAAKKGLLRARLVCPACGAQLAEETAEWLQVERRIEVKGADGFTVRVECPRFRCAGCDKESALPEKALHDSLLKASVSAFRSAEVQPS